MIHDSDLLDKLSELSLIELSCDTYRATRNNLDPLAPSTNGGRWMLEGEYSVLYTSLERDGALAELTYHWGMLTPLPSKPAVLSRISVGLKSTLHIVQADLKSLGVDLDDANNRQCEFNKMRRIGAAAAFLDIHGLIVPSVRWDCDNLIIFTDNLHESEELKLVDIEEVDWKQWGKDNGMLP